MKRKHDFMRLTGRVAQNRLYSRFVRLDLPKQKATNMLAIAVVSMPVSTVGVIVEHKAQPHFEGFLHTTLLQSPPM